MGLGVSGVGGCREFSVQGLGFRVSVQGFGVLGFWGLEGSGFGGVGLRVWGFGV